MVATTYKDRRPGGLQSPGGVPLSPGPDFPVTCLQEISSAVRSWMLGSKPAWWGPSKLPQHLQFYMQEALRFQRFVRVRSSPWLGSVCLAGAKGPPPMGFPLNLLQRQTVSLSIWSLKRPGLLPRSCSQIYVGKFPWVLLLHCNGQKQGQVFSITS